MRTRAVVCAGCLLALACTSESSSPPDAGSPDAGSPDAAWLDREITAADFGCILDGTKVRRFYVRNLFGYDDETLAVARSTTGGTFPPGTLIQLIPQEAMVKHAPGWDPATNDWEFFYLDVSASGTSIRTRGAAETENPFGGNCFGCHSLAAPQWDFLCEQGHGCVDLPFTEQQIALLQDADPRCP